jgi:hypothetical protein
MQSFHSALSHLTNSVDSKKVYIFKFTETANILVLNKYMYCYFMLEYVCINNQSTNIIIVNESELKSGSSNYVMHHRICLCS